MKELTGNDEYFAALTDYNRLADEMTEKIRIWRKWCDEHGLSSLWKRKIMNYYGVALGGNSSQAITAGGAEGELSMIKVNDLHALIQEQLVIVTSQRPAGNARAINSNTDCLKSAKIGAAVAEYYMSEKDFETKFVTATEKALLVDECFLELFWDKMLGKAVAGDPATGEKEMAGDATLRSHCPWFAARDPACKIEDSKWFIFSIKSNKFDLAEMYPKFREVILSGMNDEVPNVEFDKIPDGSDMIFQHALIHDRTPACPDGRFAVMINGRIIVDTEQQYDDFPVERIAASDVIDGCVGYAPSNDVMALEQATDGLHSVVLTNQISFGGQVLIGPENSNINTVDLAKGVRFFEVDPLLVDKIKPLDLLHTPPEIFKYIEILNQKKERATGSVSTSLAQQAAQGASGSSMALIQTQSISFNSGIQRAYFKLLSRTMTKLIRMLQKWADTERIAAIAGKSKSAGLKEFKFTGSDLSKISSVVYDLVNPMVQTYGGRLTFAQDLLKAGQLKSPKQYINVATTGNVDVITEDDEADGLIILEENEWLQEGKPFQAVITQIHADHIKSHTSQITLQSQGDPAFVARVLQHIQGHINLWMQASINNPGILLATGQQPLFLPSPPPGVGGGPSGPAQTPTGPGAPHQHPGVPEGPGQQESAPAPVIHKAQEVKPPALPTNPATGQKPTIPGVTAPGQ